MADQNMRDLVAQLQKLTPEQVKELQIQIDQLERKGTETFHVSHQTPGSHHTVFTTKTSLAGSLGTIEEQASQVRGR